MARKKKKKKPMDGLEALKAALGPPKGKAAEPVEETPVEETPVEETPVEETPVEETPVEEIPEEETPVEETPVEETPDDPLEEEGESDPTPDSPPYVLKPHVPSQPTEPQTPNMRRKSEMTDDNREGELPTGDLDPIQKNLESIFQAQAQSTRSAEEQVLSNLREGASLLEGQYRKIIDMLRNNELHAREAGKVGDSVKKRRDMKASIETAIEELKGANDQIEKNLGRLDSEKEGLIFEKEKATGENDEFNAVIRELTEDIASLSTENDELGTETAKLEKERDRLEEDVRRLTRLKEEYLANVSRFREGESS
jgi:uncharacterized coiled-coil DUF342 family protein